MNSKQGQSFMNHLAQGKMARLEGTLGTLVPSGLPKADNVPQYSQDQSLPYRRNYLTCSLSGQEALDLPSAWSPSRTCVGNGESPVVCSSATEGSITNPVFYRHEKVAFPADTDSPAAAEKLATKHKFTCYNGSKQSPSTPHAVSPIAFKKIPIVCSSLSPSTAENTVGLAIPKPVYGHSPCCTDRKCPVGQNYTLEHGLPRMPPQMFDDDWAVTYSHWAYLHKRKQEALMQQRIMPFEHCGKRVPLKDVNTQGYHGVSPSIPTTASAFTEPSHSNYPFSPSHPFVPVSSEHCERLQMHPQMQKHLPPLYEPLTRMHYGAPTLVYQDHPHISKYGPQHSLLYCPQNNTDVYGPDNPHHVVEKQASGQCPVPKPYYSSFPDHSFMVPSQIDIRKMPAYPGYRMHLNTSQVNPFTERPCPPPSMHPVDRPLDFSMRREQNADFQQKPHAQFGITGAFHQTQVLNHSSAHNCTPSSSDQSQDGFTVNSSPNYTSSPQCPNGISNEKQAVYIADSPANSAVISKRHREENDSFENVSLEKVQKMDQQKPDELQSSSPPMPVINKVFSLAPYKAYLDATSMFSPVQDPSNYKVETESKQRTEEPERQSNVKTTSGQDDLKLKVVKTPQDGSHDSDDLQILKVKKEKVEPDDVSYQSEMDVCSDPVISNNNDRMVKEEPADFKPAVGHVEHNLVVVKSDFETECKPLTPEMPEPALEWKVEHSITDNAESVQTQDSTTKPSDLSATLPPKAPSPLQTPQTIFSLSKIPMHCLKLSSYNIIVPEVLKAAVPAGPGVLQSPAETRSAMSSSRQARHQFMELHQSLCRLILACVSQSSHWELREWISSLDLISPTAKTQKVACLLGSKFRKVWLRDEETVAALQKVLFQFENYIKKHECPFPHVIRAGAVFIPMLVVKEILFPQVQGTFIDQVLQEHRVELRPTTLSEERHLTQLHRRAFSSKLRRLLSLKQLPDIYPDVLNLLYYASVCKLLGVELDTTFKRENGECSDDAEGSGKELEVLSISPRVQISETVTQLVNLKEASCLKKHKNKGRVKSSCKKKFLGDDSSSPEDEPVEESWCFESYLEGEEWEDVPTACVSEEGPVEVTIEETEQELENSWRCPLTSDDLSSQSSDAEIEAPTGFSPQGQSSSNFSKNHSSMVLKLRKVYYTNSRQGQVSHYQRVLEHSEAQDMGNGRKTHRHHRRKREHRAKNKKHHTLSNLSRQKYCPYPSTQQASTLKQRWVLRSAVQTARQAMRNRYPELVGKRIRHLYEENDKTEVWYRGVVLRIHEPHPNPLKTVYEVKYDSEPEWQYYLELLVDYKKGWLKIED